MIFTNSVGRHPFVSAIILLTLLTIGVTGQTQKVSAPSTPGCRYELTFADDLQTVSVSASIPLALGRLEIDSYGAWNQPQGWATFVRGLSVTDDAGRPLGVSKSGRLTWEVADRYSGRAELRYEIDVSYAGKPGWPEGPHTTSALTDGKALVVLAKSLIIRPVSPPSAEITIQVPNGWSVSTPWRPTSSPETFAGASLTDMTNNMIAVGRHRRQVVESGRFTAELVVLGYDDATTTLMAGAAKRILDYIRGFFGFEGETRYLMVWSRDGIWETGEAYESSYAAVWPEKPTRDNVVIWSDSIAHELLHLWNGHRFAPAERAQSQWFLEGFTEYVANLACLRSGVINRADYYRIMEKHLLMYWMYRWNGPWKSLSLTAAGANKTDYNAALYDGGLAGRLLRRRPDPGAQWRRQERRRPHARDG